MTRSFLLILLQASRWCGVVLHHGGWRQLCAWACCAWLLVPAQAQPVPQPDSGQTPAPTQDPAEATQPTDGTPPPPTDGGQ